MAAVAATAAADPLLREVTELVRAAVAKVCPQGLGVLEDPKAAVGFRPAYLSKPGAAVADLECKAPSLIFWRLRAGGKRKRPRSRSPSPGAGPEPSPGASSDLVAISSAQGAASDVDLEGLTERIVEAMDTAIVTRLLAGVHHRDHGSAKGTIVMVSRRANLRAAAAGFLLCGACGRFAKGETGLWWHVMKAHLSSVVDAKETAARASEAIQLYDAAAGRHTWHAASMEPPLAPAEETGDLAALRALAAEGQWDANERDRNGATPLLWAAGGGHLGVVRFLVEEAGVDAADLQTGRRGYAGRSALHWACRNGHVGVAAYLVGKGCAKDIATQDGTTPFHFAAWQGRKDVCDFLAHEGTGAGGACDVRHSNSYGCNAALWCAQGVGGADFCAYLHGLGVDFGVANRNGHSAVHKAAQRGAVDVVEWLMEAVVRHGAAHPDPAGNYARFFGADVDGHIPSELAALEGHASLAARLREIERHFDPHGKPEPDARPAGPEEASAEPGGGTDAID